MRLLLDQGLPRGTVQLLRDAEHDAVHAGECGLGTATDEMVLERADQERRIIITFDSDFHTLLALRSARSPSVIRIRIEGLRAEACADLIKGVLADCQDDLRHGPPPAGQGAL